MVKLREEQTRLQGLLKETITLLCKNGLSFDNGFSIDALIGITTDDRETFIVKLEETVDCLNFDDDQADDEKAYDDADDKPSVSRKRSAGRDATSTPLKRHRSDSIDADPGEVDDEDWQPEQDGDESATVKKELTYDEDAQVDDADPDGGFDASYDSSTSANDTRTPGSKQVGTRRLSFAISQ